MVKRSNFHADHKDRMKSDWDIQSEILELKRKKNKDVEDIKIMKVELNKLETLYKKFKDSNKN